MPEESLRICVPITGRHLPEVVDQLHQAARQDADLVELRLDYWSEPSIKNLRLACESTVLPVIVTARAATEGGQHDWQAGERARLWHAASELKLDYLDVELASLSEWRATGIPLDHTRLILSSHDFNQTPAPEGLQALADQARSIPNAIFKLAAQINQPEDIERLEQLLNHCRQQRQDCVIIGMGEQGRATRVDFPRQGALWTYAALDQALASAPGQWTIAQLRGR